MLLLGGKKLLESWEVLSVDGRFRSIINSKDTRGTVVAENKSHSVGSAGSFGVDGR